MINPILASSGRRRMRTIWTPILVTLYCAAMSILVYFYAFHGFSEATMKIGQMRKGVEAYVFVLGLQFVLLILVAPAMTAGSIAGERERQTLDLLRVTNTGSFSIVMGKLLESFGFLCLLIVSSLPVLSLILVTGGASFAQMMTGVLFLMLVALAALSIGLFASSLLKRTVTAAVVSYLAIFGLGVLTLIPLFWDTQKIGEIYDAAQRANQPLTTIDHVPIAFVINPALGLISLVSSQTKGDIITLVFGQFSHTLNVTAEYLQFEKYLTMHMIFLACVSVVLLALSAWFVRPQRHNPRISKRKKI